MERNRDRLIIGLVIIIIGVISLLNNFGVTAVTVGYFFGLLWPLLLITAGLNLIRNRNIAGYITGAILVIFGVLFLVRNSGLLDFDLTWFWQVFWPLLIIIIGVNIMVKSNRNQGGNVAIMGAVDKTKDAWNLQSGEYTAIMGGIELDIRKANFTEREVRLTLSAIMGGITIIVPEDVAVICTGTAIMGGVEVIGKGSGGIFGSTNLQWGDPQTAAKVLFLNCTCIMGGIEIKH